MAYRIQHDWLFSDDDLASSTHEKDVFGGKFNLSKALPVRLSSLLSDDGERYFNHFSQKGCPILLQDDVLNSDNPVISSYKSLLIRALVLRFRRKGVACMVR